MVEQPHVRPSVVTRHDNTSGLAWLGTRVGSRAHSNTIARCVAPHWVVSNSTFRATQDPQFSTGSSLQNHQITFSKILNGRFKSDAARHRGHKWFLPVRSELPRLLRSQFVPIAHNPRRVATMTKGKLTSRGKSRKCLKPQNKSGATIDITVTVVMSRPIFHSQ